MKKLVKSAFIVAGAAAIVAGAALAYFSDTETSVGNAFVAGMLDLKVSNESYYHGPHMVNEEMVVETHLRTDLSWDAKDLAGELFFNYVDLKPGDWGEDTIDLEVHDNPAWVCVAIDVTANDDVDCTEPELVDDASCDGALSMNGELADELYFYIWVDDGDNVFEFVDGEGGVQGEYDPGEETELLLTSGSASNVLNDVVWPIADSTTGYGPLQPYDDAGNPMTYYVGKFWCYGTVTMDPMLQDGTGDARSPLDGSGFLCDGKPVSNASQTDNLMGNVTFYAEQWRHNDGFECGVDWNPFAQ